MLRGLDSAGSLAWITLEAEFTPTSWTKTLPWLDAAFPPVHRWAGSLLFDPDMLIGTIGNVTASLRLKASHAVSDRNMACPVTKAFEMAFPQISRQILCLN